MNLNDYQAAARKTAIYPAKGSNIVYPTLGLCGEAGEVAENVKKLIRDDDGNLTDERRKKILKEMGGVFWYLANLCCELDSSLEQIADINLSKLQERQRNNKLHGEGDER